MNKISNRKRIIVTRGAGFLGLHLCGRSPADGRDVLCLGNFFGGTNDNVAHLASKSDFELLRQFDPMQTAKRSVQRRSMC